MHIYLYPCMGFCRGFQGIPFRHRSVPSRVSQRSRIPSGISDGMVVFYRQFAVFGRKPLWISAHFFSPAKKSELKSIAVSGRRLQIAGKIPPFRPISRMGSVIFGKLEMARTGDGKVSLGILGKTPCMGKGKYAQKEKY